MRTLICIMFSFTFLPCWGQEWRDSLEHARKSYENGKYVEALQYYRSAQKNAPEEIDLSDEIGQSAYKAREFEMAEKVYQQSAQGKASKTDKADNWHNIGNARMKKRDYSGAVEAYKESLRQNPNDEETRYNLSEALRRLEQQKKKQNQQNQQNKQDQQDQQQGDQQQGDNQQNNQGQQGDDANKGDQQNQQNNNSSGDGKSDTKNQGQLGDKTVEKMLDKLMKEEAETKRQMGSGDQNRKQSKSGKDW